MAIVTHGLYLLFKSSETIRHLFCHLVPEKEVIQAMRRRESELNCTRLVQRAYSLCCSDRRAVTLHIWLRIVREFGLPDSAVELLHSCNGGVADQPTYQQDLSLPLGIAGGSSFGGGACYLTPDQFRRLTPDQFRHLTPDQCRRPAQQHVHRCDVAPSSHETGSSTDSGTTKTCSQLEASI